MVIFSFNQFFILDICIGAVNSNRDHNSFDCIGGFVNTFAVRQQVNSESSFDEICLETIKNWNKLSSYWDTPYNLIIESLLAQLGSKPLFQVIFSATTIESELSIFKSKGFKSKSNHSFIPSVFDLNVNFTQNIADNKFDISFIYSDSKLDTRLVGDLSERFKLLLDELFIKGLSFIPVNTLNIQLPYEKTFYHKLNSQTIDFIEDITISDLIRNGCKNKPDAIAVTLKDEQISFAELYLAAKFVAKYLTLLNLSPGSVIAVYGDIDINYIKVLTGIILGGYCYFGLSKKNALERNSSSVITTNTKLIISIQDLYTTSEISNSAQYMTVSCKEMFQTLPELLHDIVLYRNSEKDLPLYIIATSGSTGSPKHVQITSSNFITFYYSYITVVLNQNCNSTLQISSITFDAHILEILPSIFSGFTLNLLTDEEKLDIDAISNIALRNNVTHALVVPSMANVMVDHLNEANTWYKMKSFKIFMMGGEAMPTSLCKSIVSNIPEVRIFNLYGPAECSIVSTFADCTDIKDNIQPPIGRPLPNYSCLVLDESLCPVSIGAIGQLFIGGPGVFSGYVNQSDLTANVIINLEHLHHAMGKAYKTGDLVKLLPSCELLFVGRVDFQVYYFFNSFLRFRLRFVVSAWNLEKLKLLF